MIYYLQENELENTSAVLRITGPDANTYLQGQFTQELRIPPGRIVYGLWLDQKGKILADSHIAKQADNDYLIASFSCSASALRARLEAYLIADEVSIEDQTTKWSGLLLWGEGIETTRPPAGAMILPSRRAGPAAVQWLVPADSRDAVRGTLPADATPADVAAAERSRLRCGLPAVPVDLGPRDLPNEGGLDEVAISYTKGCYLGQEVMARLKNLGTVRRRVHLVRGAGTPPPIGTSLFQADRKVGELRSAAADGEGFLGMAMLSLVNLNPSAGLARDAGSAADLEILRRV
jgi:folate-binding protein YgfZ